MIRVAIVDDHAIVRAGLREYFSALSDLEVVGEAANGRDAQALAREGGIDVLLLDISMPDQSGIEVLQNIKRTAPDMAVLILSGLPEEQYAVNLVRQGARGYLSKESDTEEIAKAIRAIAAGKRYVPPKVAELLMTQLDKKTHLPLHESLSPRELQVLLRMAKGETITEIGKTLSLSVKTVSTYHSRIFEKLGVTSNAALVQYAIKNGLIQ